MNKLFPVLLLAALLSACASNPSPGAPSAATTIIKPAIDPRDYRAITLANGIRAVLVSDPHADKSAAALAVQRGSFDEPANKPGLAHFLEHMLFLGNEKYPVPDSYATFITTHGGSNNAYTAGEHTNFFFDIAPDHFTEALDQFAQFFIAPTFDAKYVDREMHAVNSEYELHIKEDAWRGNEVEKLALNPAHPAARFTIGSLETLQDTPPVSTREELMKFYKAAYAPQDMTLAVYGRESLDELEALVRKLFTPIPKRTGLARAPVPPLSLPGSLPRYLQVQPVRDERTLSFNFPLPDMDRLYREKPAEYLANLIGHEGVGSLHAALKAKGWIEGIEAGAGRIDADNSEFSVTFRLTAAGAAHQQEIGAALFAYIDLLHREGVLERLFKEQGSIARLGFDYAEQGRAIGLVTGIVVRRALYPLPDLLRAPAAFDHWDAQLVQQTLAALRPDNVLVAFTAPEAKTSATERWFHVPYSLSALPVDFAAAWHATALPPGISLPGANPFLPERLALVAGASTPAKPQLLPARAGLRVWELPDTEFLAPRADVFVRLVTPRTNQTASDAAYASLFVQLVRDNLNGYSYPADLAGLSYELHPDARGMLITLGGFDDKQPELLDTLLRTMSDMRIAPDKFAIYSVQLQREWANTHQGLPYEQALAELPHLGLRPHWSPDELRAALAQATVNGLEQWRKRALTDVSVDLLAHGNVDAAKTARLVQVVSAHLAICSACTAQRPAIRRIDQRLVRTLQVAHDNASMVMYAQGDTRDYSERARFGLLTHMLREPYFEKLRTEQQLGYVVTVEPAVINRVPGAMFVVQSPVAGPQKIIDSTFAFLRGLRAQLAAMPEAVFAAQVAGLRSRLLEKERNLATRSGRLWADLDDDITTFDSRQQIAAELTRLSKADFLVFYDDFLNRVETRRVIVQVPGKFPPAAGAGTDVTKPGVSWTAF